MSEPLLTTRAAAVHCGYPDTTQGRHAFDKFVREHGVPFTWWGKRKRFRASEMDRAMRAFAERRRASLRRAG